MMILDYPTKKILKDNIGQPLRFEETSIFGPEYVSNGNFVGSNRPYITGHAREFFAKVTMKDDIIVAVE
jgi:hypothetical protein